MLSVLMRLFGWTYIPISVIAKLPFAMSVVAVLTAVAATRESYTLAGSTAALVGLGTAVSGPLIGAAADRWGQRIVLIVTALANAAALFGLAVALRLEVTTPVVLAAGMAIGLTSPQASSMVRTRWLYAIRATLTGTDARKVTSKVLSYESMTDELVFVFGPVIVGIVAVALGVVVPLDFAAVLTGLGVLAFAVHPSVRFTTGHARQPASAPEPDSAPEVAGASQPAPAEPTRPAPVREIYRLIVIVPVFGMTSIGVFFGASLTSLSNFMERFGRADAAGVYYGIMGVGSAILALSVVLLPERFTFTARWLVFGSLALAGSIVMHFVSAPLDVVLPLVIMGCGIGPALVTLYSIASDVAPFGRTTTVMAMMSTGVVVGQSGSSALTGVIIDRFSYYEGFHMITVATALLVCLGGVQLLANQSEHRRRSTRIA
ncbi:MFS transporter [Brevibacterium luteolum]|uniref:MFS transporter n=1 Tax=Brevibacterium luteolum TaxID=199591 RepID=A0A6G8KYU0_9MICO|nr:MFS transporter [Brevibacterium luteolum]QIN29978.1 MFS transporter [Brevibacterium luteolum]